MCRACLERDWSAKKLICEKLICEKQSMQSGRCKALRVKHAWACEALVVVQCGVLLRNKGGLAQLGEHLLCKQGVVGSIPSSSTNWNG